MSDGHLMQIPGHDWVHRGRGAGAQLVRHLPVYLCDTMQICVIAGK